MTKDHKPDKHISAWIELVHRNAVFAEPERAHWALSKMVADMEATLRRGTNLEGRPLHHMTRKSLERTRDSLRKTLTALEDILAMKQATAAIEAGLLSPLSEA